MFQGNRQEVDNFLKSIGSRFYVYVLCRPNGTPFYVGKGRNRRLLEHEAEARRAHPVGESNPFKCNVIRKILREGGKIAYEIDSHYEQGCEADCLAREAELIAKHRRLHEGGCLTNLAGGLGRSSGSSPFSLRRHADTLSGEPENNLERATINRFLQGFGDVGSVPVKPLAQMSRVLPTTPHPSPRSPTRRAAYALLASAVATGQVLEGEAVHLRRSFSYEGIDAIIENGVSRDILKAGMARLEPAPDPAGETFILDARHLELLVTLLGKKFLENHGLL